MCYPSVGRSATLQSIVQAFAMLAENYVDLHMELGNHPSRSLLLNSLISFGVWDLYSISSGCIVIEALLNSISTFPLWIQPTLGTKFCKKQKPRKKESKKEKKRRKRKLPLKFQFLLHSQIQLFFSFILKHLQVFIYVVFVVDILAVMSTENVPQWN